VLITKLQGAVQPPQQQHSMRIPRYRRGHFPESTAETVDAVARPSQVIALNRRRRNEMPRVRLWAFRGITVALIHARSAPRVIHRESPLLHRLRRYTSHVIPRNRRASLAVSHTVDPRARVSGRSSASAILPVASLRQPAPRSRAID
jgi:hypothetical protein